MRILMLEPNFVPTSPAGGQMLLLAERLSERHQVSVVAVDVHSRLAEKVEWIRIPPTRGHFGSIGEFFALQRAFAQALRQLAAEGRRFDVVHSVDPKLRPPSSLVYGKYVATWHFCAREAWQVWHRGGMRYPGPDRRLRLWYNHLGWVRWGIPAIIERFWVKPPRKGVDTWVAVSKGLAGSIKHFYGTGIPVEVIPNAVEHARYRDLASLRQLTRERLRIPEGRPLLLTVAHGQWGRKGLFQVLLALTRLSSAVTLAVVGGSRLEHLRSEVARLDLSDRVILVGFAEDPRPYYAAADMFILASYYESFSLVAMEAAAAGLPVLATRVHGVSGWLKDGCSGLFVGHNPEDIARKIELLIQDEALRRRLSEGARPAIAPYTPEAMVRAYERIYSEGHSPWSDLK